MLSLLTYLFREWNMSKAHHYEAAYSYLFFNFIGKFDFKGQKKEQEFAERMLDKLLSGYDDETTRLRRYKNLPRQPRHQISRLHLRNNPYPEGHPRSYCECP